MKKEIIAKLGEEIACRYLETKGYKILERNYRYRYFEADIIASINDILVVVEVKTRKDYKYLYANEAVNYKKQYNLILLTENYVNQNCLYNHNIRFDVIECYWDTKEICHIINAFEA